MSGALFLVLVINTTACWEDRRVPILQKRAAVDLLNKRLLGPPE